jgi:hypothetical protein
VNCTLQAEHAYFIDPRREGALAESGVQVAVCHIQPQKAKNAPHVPQRSAQHDECCFVESFNYFCATSPAATPASVVRVRSDPHELPVPLPRPLPASGATPAAAEQQLSGALVCACAVVRNAVHAAR